MRTMYQAIYKCRLCGEIFSKGVTGEDIAKVATESLSIADSTIAIAGCALYIRTIHYCQDGSFGLADFLGFMKLGD